MGAWHDGSRRGITLLLLTLLSVPALGRAATVVTVDHVTDDTLGACDDAAPGDCSLRGAIQAANARLDETTILVPAGTYLLSGTGPCTWATTQFGTAFLNAPSLCLAGRITLLGDGADATIIDAALRGPAVLVSNVAPVTVRGVTIQHGRQAGGSLMGGGGGIAASGDLTLVDSVVRDNAADAGGAGIYNSGLLTVVRSRIENNVAPTNAGGGLTNYRFFFDATVHLVDSVVANNFGGPQGGGIFNYYGILTVAGSTLHGNTTDGNGAALYTLGGNLVADVRMANTTVSGNVAKHGVGGAIYAHYLTVTELENVTITANHIGVPPGFGYGGGIGNADGAETSLRNTIIAGNTTNLGGPDCQAYAPRDAALHSRGHNLIGNVADCDLDGDTASTLTGVAALLGPLADNGGPTPTHALADGSPAIDAGSPAVPGTGNGACAVVDQRGRLRPPGARCDIGAFERAPGFALAGIRPNRGGRGGAVLAAVAGSGFAEGASVRLVRAGQADRVAAPAAVGVGGAAVTASFDLADAVEGPWDVVVENPDGAIATLPGAFTVEPAADPSLWVSIVGRNRIRTGRLAKYTIAFGNRGNVDAVAVPITIGVPGGYALHRLFDLAPPPALPGQAAVDWTIQPETVVVDQQTGLSNVTLMVPRVPAGFTGTLRIALLTPPGATDVGMGAIVGDPLVRAPGGLAPDAIDSAVAGARAYAERALGTPVPAAFAPALANRVVAQYDAIVAEGLDALVGNDGVQQRVYPLAHLQLDLALYARALATSGADTGGGRWLARLGDRMLALLARVAPGAAQAGPCNQSGVLSEGSGCGDTPFTMPPPDDPKNPRPLTPAECRDLPNHTVSNDGSMCVPKDKSTCAIFANPVGAATDPRCTRYPIGPKDSVDPNDKVGVLGGAAEHWVTPGIPLGYTIFFENLETAAAPAQTVEITDRLDVASVDLATFELGSITFGAWAVAPLPGARQFTGAVDLRPAQPLIVAIDAGLDETTGVVAWRFTAIDPATGQLTADPDLGFLPPNVAPPAGEGSVGFTVRPRAGLADGTTIANAASIVFDVNPAIATPTWTNRVDGAAPATAVTSARATGCSGDVAVAWSGQDAGGGVAAYDVHVSTDGGPFVPWLTGTAATSGTWTGSVGHAYAFHSIGHDAAGNVEAPPAVPDATLVVGACAGNDLAITRIATKRVVTLTASKPRQTVVAKVQIQNRGAGPETIANAGVLAALVRLDAASLGACTAPVVTLASGKPQKALPVTLKPKAKLDVAFLLTLDCANDPTKGTPDVSLSAGVDRGALGAPDPHAEDDVCPRKVPAPGTIDASPAGPILDKGCGAKRADKTFGDPVLVDVVRKP